MQIILDITDYVIIYGTYFILLIHIYLLISNFAGHFKFHHRCPCIIKDEEISGIYPTLLIFYILISFLISSFIVYITWDDPYYSAHSTFNYTNCYIQFEIYSTNVLQPNFIDNVYNIIILLTISILFLLETYFSYNRYYGCMMVVSQFRAPSKLKIFLPYTIYIMILLLIIWCVISIMPILMIFVCIFHFLINTYFSYCFYKSVKFSYMQVFKLQKTNMRFLGGAYYQMKEQIKQIRLIYILATLSSLISGFINCSFALCNTLRLLPFGLFCNILLLFLMFNRNRTLLINTLLCKCKKVNYSLCKQPCTILKKRRDSVWAPPSTLMKIKTTSANSLKVLRGLPKQMTPNFIKVRTTSNAITKTKKGEEAPPNTPRLTATTPATTPQQTSEVNLDIITEDEENKFSLDGNNTTEYKDDDLTQSTGTIMMERLPSSKRTSNTMTQSYINSDDMMNNIIYGNKSSKSSSNNNNNIINNIGIKRNYLKPYHSLTKSSSTQTTQSTQITQTLTTPQQSIDLDTIPAEDEIIQFVSDNNNINSIPNSPTNNNNIKKYRTRQDSQIFHDETHIKYGENINNNIDDECMLEHALTFGRMQNLRATMREDHINEIKIELGSLNSLNQFEDDEKYEKKIELQDIETEKEIEDDKRNSLQKQVEQIELTKEELEREKKLLQLKKKANKRIAFGADMALEIVQESILKQEEKRKMAQHEFYVHELFSVKSQKLFKASTAHHVNQLEEEEEENHSIKELINAPKHTPVTSLNNDEYIGGIIGFKHQNSYDGGEISSITDRSFRSIIDLDNQNGNHLRSRSDQIIIKDIATQILMHTKQLKKLPSERKNNNNNVPKSKLKKKITPKPKLNKFSASEDQETVTPQNKLQMRNKRVKFDKNHLDPNNIITENKTQYHPKYQPSDEDVLDIYDNIRGIERSPSPPPNSMFDHENNNNNNNNNNTYESNSIFQTFRSWIPGMSQTSRKMSGNKSTRDDSDRANNINLFLKMQGFTIHSTVHIMGQIDENKQQTQTNQEIDTNINNEIYEEKNNSNAPIGHGVFNINVDEIDIRYLNDLTPGITPNINDNNDEKNNNEINENNNEKHLTTPIPMGHMIMNLDPIGFNIDSDNSGSNSDQKHIRNTSTAL